MSAHTVASLIETVHQQFLGNNLSYGHGTDNPWDEAVALVLGVTGLPDDESSLKLSISTNQIDQCLEVAEQRVSTRQPLAYLLGRCQYMGLEFEISPGVIVPRSPIGYLLQQGLEPWLPNRVDRVLDLCSGSGCLGILAAHLFPTSRVTLVELDPIAGEIARRNIAKHALQSRIELVMGDVTNVSGLAGPYDLVISNPPYVDASDMRSLPAEFQAEPAIGLAAGDDGLSIINTILAQLPNWLAPGGLFVGEVGASARAMHTQHSELPLIWPELPAGGEGVFLLEADALSSHTARG